MVTNNMETVIHNISALATDHFWLCAIGLYFYGSCFGSFMNVVAYRLPLGMSVILPSSQCPRCNHPIRAIHNIPVIGWLLLKGKCYDCHLPIAFRYPLVEMSIGILFVLMAFLGTALRPDHWVEYAVLGLRTPTDMTSHWIGYGFQMLLLCTLISAALIRWERRQIPAQVFYVSLLIGLATPVIYPTIRAVPLTTESLMIGPAWMALAEGLFGAVAGTGLGLCHVTHDRRGSKNITLALATVGTFLGFQLVAVVAVLAAAVHLSASKWYANSDGRSKIPWIVFAFLATALCIVWTPHWVRGMEMMARRYLLWSWMAVAMVLYLTAMTRWRPSKQQTAAGVH